LEEGRKLRKEPKPGRRYFIINIDEPYAREIYEILKRSQMAKGDWPEGDIDFEEWQRQTFGEAPEVKDVGGERLKVRFIRDGAVVVVKVLEQDDSLRGTGLLAEKGHWSIESHANPELCNDVLYVRGECQQDDDYEDAYEYLSVDMARRAVDVFSELIEQINEEG
jgi:hypothetical protein